ncbi:hypothetical protein ES708_04555 [subsurface metagenome]
MSPGPPFPKLPLVPPSPIKPLREVLRQGRQRVGKAGEDIRSIAEDMRGATTTAPQTAITAPPEQNPTPTITEPGTTPKKEAVATACVPCALGHFSTSAGLLNEAVRFKKEGITSNEILDRIAKVLEEQNALERVDLTPEKIRNTPDWERDLAEEALQQSRSLRHRLETLTTIEELEQAAADAEGYYRTLNREWYKRRFAHLGPEKAQRISEEVGRLSPKDMERVLKRAEELVEEV